MLIATDHRLTPRCFVSGAFALPTTVGRVTTDPASNFGARIRARRQELGGLSRQQISEQGGPAAVTISKIERAETKVPSAGTFTLLDVGLKWVPGSAARLFEEGIEPEPLDDARSPAESILTADPGAPLSATRLVELTTAARNLDAVADRHPDMSDLQDARIAVNLVTDRFLRTWLIALLEATSREKGPGGTPEPIVGVMLAQYLASPPSPGLAEEDRRDVLYLRWLMGQVDESSADPEQIASFKNRWSGTSRS